MHGRSICLWPLAFLLAAIALAGCANVVFVANQEAARAGSDPTDLTDLDAGNIGAIRDRYEHVPTDSLPASRLALLCDILLKYQELGRASDCLDSLDVRLGDDSSARGRQIARALPGKRALLALALGRPEVAARLTEHDMSNGGRYVYALAAIRTGNNEVARPIADALRRQFEAPPVFYAASIYASLGDFAMAREVLEDPARRLLADYGLSGHADFLGGHIDAAVFRLDVFDEFDFGLFGKVTLSPAANAYVEYLAAIVYLHTGVEKEAERRLDVVLAWPNITVFRDIYWRALNDRAMLSQRAGDVVTAERLLRQAIDVIESIRGSVGAEAARIAVIADKEAPYRRLVDLLDQRGDTREAVSYVERAHSRALVELLAARYRFGPPPGHAQTDALVAQLDRRQGEVALAAAGGAGLALRSASLTRVAEVRRELFGNAPDVADLVTVAPPDLAQIQHSLGGHEAALVYFPGETQWHIFTITSADIVTHEIPGDAVWPLGRAYRVAVQERHPTWQNDATALYRLAVAPALEGVSATTLVIVPSGVLYYVPFAALGDGDRMLIDRFALRVVPNLSLIARPSRSRPSVRALVVGNPQRGYPNALPFAEAEAQDVAAQLPGARLLIGREATVSRFIELAADADLIHYAGHAVFDHDHPLESALLLAGQSAAIDPLAARQLYELRTGATLAFLSACETGVNYLAGGEDIMGIERGFFSAGVGSVVASLWPVQDQATSILADAFYRAWSTGASASRALQAAQIAVRQQFPAPLLWSGFVVASVGAE